MSTNELHERIYAPYGRPRCVLLPATTRHTRAKNRGMVPPPPHPTAGQTGKHRRRKHARRPTDGKPPTGLATTRRRPPLARPSAPQAPWRWPWTGCRRSSPSARPPQSCGSAATSSTRPLGAASSARSASAAASASPSRPCWTCSPTTAHQRRAAMSSRGNIYRRCVKGHRLAQRKCSGRCLRWYPRIELPRGPDGKRGFSSLGGYPTRKQAEAAVAEELQRRSHALGLEPHRLTVNQYLDRWLAHIQTTRRVRTVARYRTLLAHHVRPYIGAQLLTGLEPLQVQGIYDQLGVGGRKDGRP